MEGGITAGPDLKAQCTRTDTGGRDGVTGPGPLHAPQPFPLPHLQGGIPAK